VLLWLIELLRPAGPLLRVEEDDDEVGVLLDDDDCDAEPLFIEIFLLLSIIIGTGIGIGLDGGFVPLSFFSRRNGTEMEWDGMEAAFFRKNFFLFLFLFLSLSLSLEPRNEELGIDC
jgi:hypothetical protein